MSLTLAGVGAVAAALLEFSVAPYFRVGGAQPDLVLVFAVVWTMIVSFEGGMVWAFIGGLTTDLLGSSPLGITVFSLLVVVALAALIGHFLPRARYLSPIVVVLLLSVVNALLVFFLYGALSGPVHAPGALDAVLPGAAYNGAIALVVAPLMALAHARFAEQERIDW